MRQQSHSSIFERISKALHTQYDDIANGPLPERWVDLINYLNESERKQLEDPQHEAPQPETEPHVRRSSRSN